MLFTSFGSSALKRGTMPPLFLMAAASCRTLFSIADSARALASIRSGGAVEQLLGRVLRMPFATRRPSEELNRAYAHVSERNFFSAAEGLTVRLTQMGFDERTALEAIVEQPGTFDWREDQPLFTRPELPVLRVQERPDQSGWTPEMVAATRITDDGAGGVAITFDTAAPDTVLRDVAAAVTTATTSPAAAVEAFLVQRAATLSPAEQGEVLTLPRLAIERDGQIEMVKHGGEEWMAAVAIDDHPAVLRWVRNVDRTAWSCALPTATDLFYPDFVAELFDGRKFIVEHKGADRTDNTDSHEKLNIGARLQEVSGGSVVFLWAELDNGGCVGRQIDAATGRLKARHGDDLRRKWLGGAIRSVCCRREQPRNAL